MEELDAIDQQIVTEAAEAIPKSRKSERILDSSCMLAIKFE